MRLLIAAAQFVSCSIMPHLSKIILTQFKNYPFTSFHFNERVTGICGLNGKGKTNLLDAIYYLCFTKSYFSRNDAQNICFGMEGFRLEGIMDETVIVCIFRGTGKKEFLINDTPYSRYSEHIGKYPAVMIAPDDIELVTGGSEERRRYLDTLLSQTDTLYLQHLITYNKILVQRNSLLKRFAESGTVDITLLEVIDNQMILPASYIFSQRKKLLEEAIGQAQMFYARIADNEDEKIALVFESQLIDTPLDILLKKNRQKDMLLQRTSAGIHKDDISIRLNGQPFKAIASQGQRKSLLFALKLTEFEILKKSKGFAPLLLLDDVFEKLDDRRMHNLLHWVCNDNSGQVFITDTHKKRLEETFKALEVSFQIISL